MNPRKLNPDDFRHELAKWLREFLIQHVSVEADQEREIEQAAVQAALNATKKVSVRRILQRVTKGRMSLDDLCARGRTSRYHKEAYHLIREHSGHDWNVGKPTPWMVAMYEIENEENDDADTAFCGDWPLSEERLRAYLASGGKWEADLGPADSIRQTDMAIARLDRNEPFKNRLLEAVREKCTDEIPDELLTSIKSATPESVSKPPQAGVADADPETAPSKEAKALGVLTEHPEWTNKKIAETVGVARTTLYKWPKYVAARKVLTEAGRDHRKRRSDSKGRDKRGDRRRHGKAMGDTFGDTQGDTYPDSDQ